MSSTGRCHRRVDLGLGRCITPQRGDEIVVHRGGALAARYDEMHRAAGQGAPESFDHGDVIVASILVRCHDHPRRRLAEDELELARAVVRQQRVDHQAEAQRRECDDDRFVAVRQLHDATSPGRAPSRSRRAASDHASATTSAGVRAVAGEVDDSDRGRILTAGATRR
jgi:hypothetical protein